jgi:hypothetical protein
LREGGISNSGKGNAMIAEGTVPVTPHRPCAERDSDVLPGSGVLVLYLVLGIAYFTCKG